MKVSNQRTRKVPVSEVVQSLSERRRTKEYRAQYLRLFPRSTRKHLSIRAWRIEQTAAGRICPPAEFVAECKASIKSGTAVGESLTLIGMMEADVMAFVAQHSPADRLALYLAETADEGAANVAQAEYESTPNRETRAKAIAAVTNHIGRARLYRDQLLREQALESRMPALVS